MKSFLEYVQYIENVPQTAAQPAYKQPFGNPAYQPDALPSSDSGNRTNQYNPKGHQPVLGNRGPGGEAFYGQIGQKVFYTDGNGTTQQGKITDFEYKGDKVAEVQIDSRVWIPAAGLQPA